MNQINYESDETAKKVTLTGWVSRMGRFFCTKNQKEDEHYARWDGCTHIKCESCGKHHPKHYILCDECREKKANEEYAKLTKVKWDRKTPIYSARRDMYFFDDMEVDDYIDECDGTSPDNLRLYLCEETNMPEYCPDDYGFYDPELNKLIDEFNERITKFTTGWKPTKQAVEI